MRVREGGGGGGGGKEGKIRLVTYARFSFHVGVQLLFKLYFEHAIITCNNLWRRLRRRSSHVFSALDYCTSTVKGG